MTASTDLVTLAEVKAFLAITDTNHDILIDELIDIISEQIEDYCGTYFSATSVVSKIDGGGEFLFMPKRPIISITSIVDNEPTTPVTVTASTYDFYEEDGHIYKKTANLVTSGETILWEKGKQRFTVTASCGYTSVPESVKLAAYLMIEQYMKIIPSANNIGRRTVPNMINGTDDDNVESKLKFTSMTPQVKFFLSKYRFMRL